MDVHLLGPIEARLDGHPIVLGPPKQRAVFAMLALRVGRTVSADHLAEGLWGEQPPLSAPKMVQLYVSHLRRLVEGNGAEIVTRGRGYELRLSDGEVDAVRFERLLEQSRAREALVLWRGEPLADLAHEPFAAAEIRRLEELHVHACELAIEADLAAGLHGEVISELDALVAEHPLRERLGAQQMLALYRSGRQAEALEAYIAARRRLVDEVGVEPGAELRDLHERMLRQDPSLRLQAATVETQPAGDRRGEMESRARAPALRARRRSPMPLLLAAAAAVLVAVAVFAVTRLTGPERLPSIDERAVGVIDPQAAAITAQYGIGSEPGAVAAGADSVWVANPGEGTVSRIHGAGDRVDTIDVGRAPLGLAFGAGSLWVAGGEDGAVAQLDPVANRVVQRIPVGNGLRAVAIGHGAVWAATELDGEVVRIDLRSGGVTSRTPVGGHPVALATSASAVWAGAEESGTVARIDARSGEVLKAIPVGNGPSALAVGLGAVWVANRQDGTVSRIDPATDRVTYAVPAGRTPVGLTIADGALWVADAAGAVLRLDPRTRAITGTVQTGSTPAGLAAVDGAIWVTAVAPPGAHRGGTLRVGRPPTIELDPARGGWDPGSVPVLQLAYEGLLAYRGGTAGTRLTGALAVAVPKPADRGRRYVFRLHRGLRYSDGTPVRAGDVRASLERALVIERDGFPPFLDAVEGAARCRSAPATCDLSRGVVTDERTGTVTIRLRRPDPELLQKLTLSLFAIVPADTPRRTLRVHPPPGTGPYRIDRVAPGRRAQLTRNPHFRPRGREPDPVGFADRVEVTMGAERALIAAVEAGRIDLAELWGATSERLTALRTRVGTRLRSAPIAQTEYAWLNVQAPPFDDPRVRRALNLAVDRARVIELSGGPDAGTPTCQLLPPGLQGHRPLCPFTASPSPAGAWAAPDRAKAKRLVAESGTRGTKVEVYTTPPRATARHLADVLQDLGFRSRLRLFDDLGQIGAAAFDPRRRPQIGLNGWIADFPEPAGFLRALISCNAYAPDNPGGSTNASRFCDHAIDHAIDRAQAAGPDAGAAWSRIERRIAEQAPVLPLVNRRWVVVTSPRTGNLQFHPLTGVLLDQLWVQ